MTDRVYPSNKQNGTTTNTAAAPPTLHPPPNKSHLYNNPTRHHPYRPNPTTRRPHRPKNHRKFSCRRCFCLTCFWSILLVIAVLLLAAIAGAAFYALYHPHRPAFSVTSVKISSFNLTTNSLDDTTHLTAKLNLTISAKNPNKKVAFVYDPMSIAVISNSVTICNGTFANFTNSPPDGIFIIHTAMGPKSQILVGDDVNSLNSDLKRRNGLRLSIVIDTMVEVKMEKVKMKKVGIRVKCEGIHGIVPKSKGRIVNPAVANTSKAKCKVDLRIKIWKWTF